MNVPASFTRPHSRTALLTVLTIFLPLSALAAVSDSTAGSGSISTADSSFSAKTTATDSIAAAKPQPLDPLVARRARGTLSLLYADTLALQTIQPETIAGAFAFYADDLLRLAPALAGGDSLGNGYSRRFSILGGGFAASGAYLDGIELGDPLTGRVDWRMAPVEILSRADILAGGHSGARGGSDEIHLLTRNPATPAAETHMGISGGAYEINKVGGGLKRRIFSGGAIQVQINKIQQSTEDFTANVENIQFYTRLQQQLSPRTLLAVDGLFFSDDFRRSGFAKQRTAATRFRTQVTGALLSGFGYSLAYGYASGERPFNSDSGMVTSGAVRHSLEGSLLTDQDRSVALAADFSLASTSLRDFPLWYQGSDSRGSNRLAARLGLGGRGALRADISAGMRSFTGGDSEPVGGVRISLARGTAGGAWLSWDRESVAPSLAATISAFGTLDPAGGVAPGAVEHLEAGWGMGSTVGWSWSLAAFHRRLDEFPAEPYFAGPFQNFPIRRISAGVSGVRLRAGGTLPGGLRIEMAGLETLDPPDDFLWMPARRYSAAAGMQGEGCGGDLGWSLRVETIYEGALRYPLGESQSSPVREQPGRFNLFGAASLRIVDFTIFGRADFLVSGYYNGADPLSLPGPRAVVGIDWLFWD